MRAATTSHVPEHLRPTLHLLMLLIPSYPLIRVLLSAARIMWHRYRDNGNGITVGNVFYTWNGGVSIDGSAAGKKTRAPIVAGRRLIGHPVSGTPAQELQLVPRLDEGLAGVPRLAEVPRSAEVPRPAEVPPLAETLSRDDPDFFDAIGSLCELARAPQPQPSQSTLDHQKLPQLKVCFFSADSAQEPEFLMYVKLLDGLFQEWNDRNPRNRERRCLDSHDIPHFVGEGLTEWSLAKPFEFVDPHAAAGAPKRCVNRVLIVARASDTLLVSFLALVIVAGNAYLVALYTHPHHRKQGLAFEALSQLSCVLDQWGIGAVVPDTHCVQKILQVPFIYKLYANSGWVVQQDPVDKQLKAISYCPGAYATIMCGPTDCHENEKSVRSGRLLRSRR